MPWLRGVVIVAVETVVGIGVVVGVIYVGLVIGNGVVWCVDHAFGLAADEGFHKNGMLGLIVLGMASIALACAWAAGAIVLPWLVRVVR